jgi:hypothetical protein
MALPMSHTFSRNASAAAVLSGKYANIRLKQISTNMNPAFPWMTLHDAVTNRLVGEHGKINDTYLNLFSATCYYFGESLTEELGSDAPPIGLIHTAYGGSMIEQWLTETTVMSCKNASNYTAVGGGEWWQSRVLPFSQMTLKGWAWYQVRTIYCTSVDQPAALSPSICLRSLSHSLFGCASQGENNMHAMFGNSQLGTGYACLMAKLVSDWRALWAKSSGTDPMAPFGLVTLAASGGEGGSDIGSMRLAQTASYGVLPNPIMPNTFFAQAGDLDDPVGTLNCYHDGCCTNMSKSPSCTEGIGCAVICKGGSTPDYSWEDTPVYMGPIHPRGKKVLGVRFARAAAASVYGKPGAATGPTITGCALSADKKTIIIKFNTSLFAGDSLEVNDYSKGNTSQMSVLVNEGKFCFQSASGKYCLDDGFGNFNSTGPVNEATDWAHVDIKLGSDPSTVEVDLTRANGTAFGVRFGWQGGGDCCADESPGNWFCESRSPVMLKAAQLPANPFMAKIVDGKCKCMPPQQCDE